MLPKRSRAAKVVGLAATLVKEGEITVSEAKPLSGALRFLREGHFGRTGAVLLNALTDQEKASGPKIASRLRDWLLWWVDDLLATLPRSIYDA